MEMHVVAQAVELCHNESGISASLLLSTPRQAGPPIERIGPFPVSTSWNV
jgi:hypothetical protein